MISDTPMPPHTAILILAGGDGRRIGGGKPDKLLNGHRLIEHAVTKARTYGTTILLQLAYKNQVECDSLPQILDEPDIEGPLAGIISGLKWCKSNDYNSMLTIPCDTPFLPDDLLERLSVSIGSSTSVAMASSLGNIHPVCALWQTIHLGQLQKNAAQGQLSLKHNAKECGIKEVVWLSENFDPFFNINTAEDLLLAETILQSK